MANPAELARIASDYIRNLAGVRTIYEPDGGRTYDHDAVALCGWCGDPIEADYDGRILHSLEDSSLEYYYRWPQLEGRKEDGGYTIYQEIEMVKSGLGAIIPSVEDPELNEFIVLSPGEQQMLEVLFPHA